MNISLHRKFSGGHLMERQRSDAWCYYLRRLTRCATNAPSDSQVGLSQLMLEQVMSKWQHWSSKKIVHRKMVICIILYCFAALFSTHCYFCMQISFPEQVGLVFLLAAVALFFFFFCSFVCLFSVIVFMYANLKMRPFGTF